MFNYQINENIDPPFAENAIIKSGKRSSSLGEEHNRELRSLRDQCNHILFATYGVRNLLKYGIYVVFNQIEKLHRMRLKWLHAFKAHFNSNVWSDPSVWRMWVPCNSIWIRNLRNSVSKSNSKHARRHWRFAQNLPKNGWSGLYVFFFTYAFHLSATKRRNFSKQAVELLNEYYLAISDNPYPNEHVKMELANRTGKSCVIFFPHVEFIF